MKVSPSGWIVIFAACAVCFWAVACSDETPPNAEAPGEHASSEGAGEHAASEGGAGGHDSGEEGEESGVYIGWEETWDATRRGARLVLSFDSATNAFLGTVENTTQDTLCAVRVEVHLSTGTELGPTERTDLPAGESVAVELSAGGDAFDSWTAHPELSPCGGDQIRKAGHDLIGARLKS